jgi:two-component system chemotaxis response regulator CheB
MNRRRVLVVDDSLTVRKRIAGILSADPELDVVGEASDGRRAIELCQALRPDVMTLDMMLPIMTGLAVTEYVMAYFPTPILIVSASLNRGEVFRTFEALAAGAVDVLEKPSRDAFDRGWEEKLVASVKLVSRIRVITHPRVRLELARAAQGEIPPALASPAAAAQVAVGAPALVAIGASTGGPSALVEILGRLPRTFPVPIVVVIHISQVFLAPLVEWLDAQSPIRVRVAEDGQALPPIGEPSVLVAPADRHLVVCKDRLRLTSEPERHSCRPSIDVCFESIARELGPRAVGCLLTGMGKDGAAGLLAMRRAGAVTLAQDERTSSVYGMPREAVLMRAAQQVLPIDEFAAVLVGCSAPAR